ncbi:30S ribosomal protein s16 [Trifolium pratense]|uniref:30S ribosomal protein s16 n=1 Tax=Trifolium pratense TaxID=57577 RepID=A0A2K3MZ50_TRIPR|nr:30S ribosomal protein s16 [Trifolium pratense]
MVVRIRLSRLGCKNKPFYRVMAADSRSPRDGKHLEVLGYYNPLPGQDGGKRMGINFDRVKITVTHRDFIEATVCSFSNIKTDHRDSGISTVIPNIGLEATIYSFKYWLSVGAQPSNPVERLLFRAGLLPPPPTVAMARKGGPRDTRPVDALTGRVIGEQKPSNSNK